MWWGQEGPIEIVIRAEDGGAVVDVHRAGTGPPEGEVETMFAGPPAEGSKIGLYLARRVAEASGGSLSAEGGVGVTFHLRLPG
jgi:signal transduction histidine kinase